MQRRKPTGLIAEDLEDGVGKAEQRCPLPRRGGERCGERAHGRLQQRRELGAAAADDGATEGAQRRQQRRRREGAHAAHARPHGPQPRGDRGDGGLAEGRERSHGRPDVLKARDEGRAQWCEVGGRSAARWRQPSFERGDGGLGGADERLEEALDEAEAHL